jgi:antitoxin CcdA
MGKIELKIEIDAELLAQAVAEGVVPGVALEEGIRAALSRVVSSSPDEEAAARQWAEENAEAIKAHRERIEKFGVFGEDLRTW